MAAGHFTGDAQLLCADGASVAVQWAATVELVTGHRRILFVALNTSRWGPASVARCRPSRSRAPCPSAS